MSQTCNWYAVTRKKDGESAGPEGYDYFNAGNGEWWTHFGDATRFSTFDGGMAMAVEFGFAEMRQTRYGSYVKFLEGYGVQQLMETRGEASTLGEDLDDGDWWK